jgi:hypothetical protein
MFQKIYFVIFISMFSIAVYAQSNVLNAKTVEQIGKKNENQLMADNDWKSSICTDYAIRGIPRFLLIGPDGKVIKADAARPSSTQLIELLDTLLK